MIKYIYDNSYDTKGSILDIEFWQYFQFSTMFRKIGIFILSRPAYKDRQ
jgi:hypothetical protein